MHALWPCCKAGQVGQAEGPNVPFPYLGDGLVVACQARRHLVAHASFAAPSRLWQSLLQDRQSLLHDRLPLLPSPHRPLVREPAGAADAAAADAAADADVAICMRRASCQPRDGRLGAAPTVFEPLHKLRLGDAVHLLQRIAHLAGGTRVAAVLSA
eukprot:364052-Chlamydomonas_euryale.AAC.7